MSTERRVPEDKARLILERAAEIDGRQANLTSIESLRSAANEAGITTQAFEAAVRELEESPPAVGPHLTRRRLLALGAVGVTTLLLGFATYFGRRAPRDIVVTPPPDTPLTVDRR